MPRDSPIGKVVVNAGYAGGASGKVLEDGSGAFLVLDNVTSEYDAAVEDTQVLGELCKLFAADAHELT